MMRHLDLPSQARVTVASDHGSMDLERLEAVYVPGNGVARDLWTPPIALAGVDADGRRVIFNWACVEAVVELRDEDLVAANSPLAKNRDTMDTEPRRLHSIPGDGGEGDGDEDGDA